MRESGKRLSGARLGRHDSGDPESGLCVAALEVAIDFAGRSFVDLMVIVTIVVQLDVAVNYDNQVCVSCVTDHEDGRRELAGEAASMVA